MASTTSPSVPILASIDGARRQMALHGEALLDRAIELGADARRRLRAIPGIGGLGGEELGAPGFDLTKLVIDVNGLGLTGFDAESLLRERFGVGPEMSDLVGVVCLVTIADTPERIDRLVAAFAAIAAEHRCGVRPVGADLRSSGAAIAPGKQAMSPREAFFAPARAVAPADAVGEISAELVIPYPPGIPVLAPGDIISAEKIAYLEAGAANGMYLSGPVDQALATIRIVDDGAGASARR
jgi:arginine/lysine/ornithine decarboxylase